MVIQITLDKGCMYISKLIYFSTYFFSVFIFIDVFFYMCGKKVGNARQQVANDKVLERERFPFRCNSIGYICCHVVTLTRKNMNPPYSILVYFTKKSICFEL